MSLISRKGLLERTRRGQKARSQLVASNLSEGIAFQIRATRDKQHMSQADLAQKSGMTPNNLCRLESPDYGKQTISSLKRIADALDVALIVRFVPFSQYIDWLSGTSRLDEGLNADSLAVDSFDQEDQSGKLEWACRVWMVNKTQIIENCVPASHHPIHIEPSAKPLTDLDFLTAYYNSVNVAYNTVYPGDIHPNFNVYGSAVKPSDPFTGYSLDMLGNYINAEFGKSADAPVKWGNLCNPDQVPIWMNEKVG
jgi:transcriptional regulator with XRE-family HTH domain